MEKSQNGWPASKDRNEIDIKIFKINNADMKIPLQKDAGLILAAFIEEFHAEVEAIDKGQLDDWGYAYRNVRGSDSDLSNHSSGTAVDLNATKHPLGKENTFNKQQLNNLRKLVSKYGLRWGGDYKKRKDEMHFEIVETPDEVEKRIQEMNLRRRITWLKPRLKKAIKKK